MVQVGDFLYDFRIVNTYHGKNRMEKPLFNGFQGIVVYNTWDTGDWQVLKTSINNGEYITEEIGVIDNEKIESSQSGYQVALFIRSEVYNLITEEVIKRKHFSTNEVKNKILSFGVVTPRNFVSLAHISRKHFSALVNHIYEYVNETVYKTVKIMLDTQCIPIAIDEYVANIIQIHDGEKF